MGVPDESARRVGDCVAYLLNEQPFFGSLALRLPIRPDPSRETLASDGHELRYAPAWVARTDGDRIKTAVARVVLACALKHHTRRGGRDPGRWQRASQRVTHGELRRAGFVLPAEAEAWDDLSVEDAYERLAGGGGRPVRDAGCSRPFRVRRRGGRERGVRCRGRRRFRRVLWGVRVRERCRGR